MKSGNFSSPNFPRHYTENVECIWTIDYVPGYLVQLEFVDRFDIEVAGSCQKDYLKIEEYLRGEWVDKGKKCGSQVPDPFISNTNKVKVTFVSDGSVSMEGFNIKYSAVCGGNFTEKTGFIVSPNYPDFYDSSLNCTYTIGTSNQYVHLSFEDDFSVEGNNDCRYDFVTISHSSSTNTDDSPQQGPYCGSEVPEPRTLQGPVTMRFISDTSYSAHGFKANYEIIDCGGTLMSTQGEIHTPSFMSQYLDKHIDCTWNIVVPTNKVVNLRLLYVNIKMTYSCWENFVELRDDLSRGIQKVTYCRNATMQFKSTGNTLTFRYYQHFSEEDINRGVMAIYHSDYGPVQGCGGIINGTGEIQSLNLNSDDFYEPNLDCSWFITTDAPDKVLKLTFERFDLEPPINNSCIYDYVELRDEYSGKALMGNGELIGRYCGSTIPTSTVTSTTKMHVMFHTDSLVQMAGFKMRYESIPSPCGPATLDVKKEPQVLTSPGYPNPYPVNLNCRWKLYANTTSQNRVRVQLNIQSIDIPCQEDYLEVQRVVIDYYYRNNYQGTPQESYPLRLCSNNPPQKLFSQNGAFLSFHSGPSNTVSKGFSITYQEASCNQTYTSDSGFITNPGYPLIHNNEKRCSVTITVSEGKTIAVYFNSMQLSGVESNCVNNFIDVYDGPNITDRHIGLYCGYEAPSPIFSSGNSLHFEMQTLYKMGSYNFIYMASDKGRGCGGSIFADQGTISSPLFPQPYNKSDECVWHIAVPGYHTVQLSFSYFTLNSTTGCESNYVEIYDGDSTELQNRDARYCGSDAPGIHVSDSNQMVVKFVSDTTNSAPGFLLNFRLNPFPPDPSSPFMQLNPTPWDVTQS